MIAPSRAVASRSLAVLAAVALACSSSTPPAPGNDIPSDGDRSGGDVVVRDGIEYRADVAVMESFPVQLAGTVTIENRSRERRRITFPSSCVALLRAYRPEDGERVWDQASDVACAQALVTVALGPGESETVRTPTASAYDILGDEHPDGAYRIAVYVTPEAGTVEIDTGTVDLAVPR